MQARTARAEFIFRQIRALADWAKFERHKISISKLSKSATIFGAVKANLRRLADVWELSFKITFFEVRNE